MFNFFKKKAEKEDVDKLKQAVQTGFNSAKQDINKLSKWVKHLNSRDSSLKDEIFEIQVELSSLKEEVEGLKNILSIVGDKQLFKQQQTVFNKQTVFNAVDNSVQTAVQTDILRNLSATERAIVFVLLNSDMKLSYEDLAAMLGKTKTTIRGQINSIKQKSKSLIKEIVSENNKKRVFIPKEVKERLIEEKKVKNKKSERNSEEES